MIVIHADTTSSGIPPHAAATPCRAAMFFLTRSVAMAVREPRLLAGRCLCRPEPGGRPKAMTTEARMREWHWERSNADLSVDQVALKHRAPEIFQLVPGEVAQAGVRRMVKSALGAG